MIQKLQLIRMMTKGEAFTLPAQRQLVLFSVAKRSGRLRPKIVAGVCVGHVRYSESGLGGCMTAK